MTLESLIESLKAQGVISSERVIEVMKRVDRSKFVPSGMPPYSDSPQPIGDGQTISAPHMHGQALELLQPFLRPGSKVLDVGCGSGYLTACMAELVSPGGQVIGIENRQSLVDLAQRNIQKAYPAVLSSESVRINLGNGWTGEGFLSEQRENVFDAIHVGAAAESMPETLLQALKSPGRMVIPVGPQWSSQVFVVVDKDKDGSVSQRELMSVMYVPLEQQVRHRGF
jgi:protein-L-isoaspartate(D-aspartate) O-methyltransferase